MIGTSEGQHALLEIQARSHSLVLGQDNALPMAMEISTEQRTGNALVVGDGQQAISNVIDAAIEEVSQLRGRFGRPAGKLARKYCNVPSH